MSACDPFRAHTNNITRTLTNKKYIFRARHVGLRPLQRALLRLARSLELRENVGDVSLDDGLKPFLCRGGGM